jgi:glucokinase
MILAGDIGGTNARLAYFQPQNGHLHLVSERTYPSREHSELGEIVASFLDDSGAPGSGMLRNRRSRAQRARRNLESALGHRAIPAGQADSSSATLLINDLEASAWGIGALSGADLVPLNHVSGPAIGNQAVIAPGTGLGEAGLFWDGSRHHVFACEGGHTDFGSARRFAD